MVFPGILWEQSCEELPGYNYHTAELGVTGVESH